MFESVKRSKPRCGVLPGVCACALFVLLRFSSVHGEPLNLPPVTLAIFRSPDCPHCTSVERPELDKLGERVAARIDTKIYDIDDLENYKLLLRVEKEFKDEDNEFPIVVVGDRLLGGNEEVEKGLERAVKDAISAGKTGLPEVVTRLSAGPEAGGAGQVSGKPVYAAFFSQGGCSTCSRLMAALAYLRSRYPSFEFRTYDTRSAGSAKLFEAVCEAHRVPDGDRRKNPGIFIGGRTILGDDVSAKSIEAAIGESLSSGTSPPWDVTGEALAAARERILGRFASLGAYTVVVAGLVDGVNPCAFATIVFFISYLVATRRSRRDMVMVGLAFAAAVFATYFAVGLGAMQTIIRLRGYAAIARAIDAAAGSAAIGFGIVSVWDYLKARSGRMEQMKLVLPSFLKRKINLSISQQLRLRGIVIGAIVAGALVSLFELACTGQVYLPTITLISGDMALKAKAIGYLTLYNLLFVLPLLVILGLAAFGMSSERLGAFFRRNVAASKLALAGLFFVIGAVVLFNMWAH